MPAKRQHPATLLPTALRLLVVEALAGGADGATVRDRLARAGVPAEDLPDDETLALFRQTPEFKRLEQRHEQWARLARERRAAWRVLMDTPEALDAVSDLAAFRAFDGILSGLEHEAVDPTRSASAIATLKRAILADKEARRKQREDGQDCHSPEEVMAALDSILGLDREASA